MINVKPGTKVICNYRGRHIGEVIEPSTDKVADNLLSQAEYCQETKRTPVQYSFGVMEDSDRSLTVVETVAKRKSPAGVSRTGRAT